MPNSVRSCSLTPSSIDLTFGLGLSLQGNFTGRKQPSLKSDALQILGALLPSLAICFASLAGSLPFSSSSSPQRADSLQPSHPKLCRTFVLYMTQHGLVDDVSPPTCLRSSPCTTFAPVSFSSPFGQGLRHFLCSSSSSSWLPGSSSCCLPWFPFP